MTMLSRGPGRADVRRPGRVTYSKAHIDTYVVRGDGHHSRLVKAYLVRLVVQNSKNKTQIQFFYGHLADCLY